MDDMNARPHEGFENFGARGQTSLAGKVKRAANELMPTYDALIFGLDGTLVDTAPETVAALADTLHELGLREAASALDESEVRRWIGHGTWGLLAHVLAKLEDAPRPEQVMPTFARNYLGHCGQRDRVYPGVGETLEALARHGVPMALATNKEARYACKVLRAARLERYFDPAVCGDTLRTRKPDAAPLRHCLNRMQAIPSRALFIGDSEIDVLAARKTGMAVWLVSYGYRDAHSLGNAGADRMIGALPEVLPAMRSRAPRTPDFAYALTA